MARFIVVVKNKDPNRSHPNKCVYIQIYYIYYIYIYIFFLGGGQSYTSWSTFKISKKNTSKPNTPIPHQAPYENLQKRPESEMATLIHSTPNKREFQRNPAFLHGYQQDLRCSCHRFCWMYLSPFCSIEGTWTQVFCSAKLWLVGVFNLPPRKKNTW